MTNKKETSSTETTFNLADLRKLHLDLSFTDPVTNANVEKIGQEIKRLEAKENPTANDKVLLEACKARLTTWEVNTLQFGEN